MKSSLFDSIPTPILISVKSVFYFSCPAPDRDHILAAIRSYANSAPVRHLVRQYFARCRCFSLIFFTLLHARTTYNINTHIYVAHTELTIYILSTFLFLITLVFSDTPRVSVIVTVPTATTAKTATTAVFYKIGL